MGQRVYNTELVCLGCQQKNAVKITKVSFIQWNTVKFTCIMCESKSLLRHRLMTGAENKHKFTMNIVKFFPSEELIAAMKEDLDKENEEPLDVNNLVKTEGELFGKDLQESVSETDITPETAKVLDQATDSNIVAE